MLGKIFGPKYEEGTGNQKQLHNEEFPEFHFSSNVWVIKSRRIRGVGQLAHMRETRGTYRVLVGKPEEKTPLRKPRIDRRMILRWILKK